MAANAVHFVTPPSVDQLSKEASDFPYDNSTPFRRWMRVADTIQKQAQSYIRDGDDSNAYFLLLRHAILTLEKLPTHPQANIPANRKALLEGSKTINDSLKTLELLKPRIETRHARYADAIERRRLEREKMAVERAEAGAQVTARDWDRTEDEEPGESMYDQKRTLAAEEHGDMALKLARNDRRKRRPLDEDIEQYDGQQAMDDTQRQMMIATSQKSQQAFVDRSRARHASGSSVVVAAPPKYPSVPGRRSTYEPSISRNPPIPPSLPPKEHLSADSSPLSRCEDATSDIQSKDFTFKPAAFTENGIPLRTIFLPSTLRSSFLALAFPNTSSNRETLGILCGTLISNAFFVSRLVVPQQSATSDTCEMSDEGEVGLWQYCDAENVMTLGWIHTHPTQTCFMSSRDLHTHGGYQAQMAESVAIVCAPRHEPAWGAFRLTDPPGLKHVLNCRQTGIFHPHSETNLYTDAMKPGHVTELPTLSFEVVDLRK